MARTNRDYIRHRVWISLAIAGAGWLMIFSGSMMGRAADQKGPQALFGVVGFLMFLGALLVAQRVKCPKCSTRLGQVAMLIGVHWGKKRRLNFCPYCGVSLDESSAKSEPVAQQTPLNPIR